MRNRVPYQVYGLRYYPNLVSGEFVNVGVALFCHTSGWWRARLVTSLPDVKCLFPTAQTKALGEVLQQLEGRLEKEEEEPGLLDRAQAVSDPLDVLRERLGRLSGALRWSGPVIEGMTADLGRELDHWYHELVGWKMLEEEEGPALQQLPTPEVSKPSRKRMEQEFVRRSLMTKVQPAVVGTYHQERFEYTYRNGGLNIFEPVSLRFKSAGAIRRRGHLWRGRLDVLAEDEQTEVTFFGLVEMPDVRFREEADIALTMIRNAGVRQVETVPDDQIDLFCDLVESVVSKGNE